MQAALFVQLSPPKISYAFLLSLTHAKYPNDIQPFLLIRHTLTRPPSPQTPKFPSLASKTIAVQEPTISYKFLTVITPLFIDCCRNLAFIRLN